MDIGRHQILLSERDGRFLDVHVQLVTADAESAAVVRRVRRTLVRQLFFLVTKRTAEGASEPGAQTRLAADLLPRFRNSVRTATIDEVRFAHHEVIVKPIGTPDGGVER